MLELWPTRKNDDKVYNRERIAEINRQLLQIKRTASHDNRTSPRAPFNSFSEEYFEGLQIIK